MAFLFRRANNSALFLQSTQNAKLVNCSFHDNLGIALTVHSTNTRQMIIIVGGEPELFHRRHAKREGGVYAPPYALRVRKSCPECSVHVLCLCRSVKKGLCEVTSEKN